MRKWPIILLTALVLVVGGRYIYGVVNRPDDKTLIKQALADAVQASKDGRAGSVIDMLSQNFTVNDVHPGMAQVVNFVKDHHPEVQIKDTDPLVGGDTAQITSDVLVKVDVLGNTQTATFKDAVLQFKKESATDWVIMPTTKWHLTAVRVTTENLPNLPNQ